MKRALIFGAAILILLVIGIIAVVSNNNVPPTAISGSSRIQEDTPETITLQGNDPDGDLLSFTIVTQPSHGKLSGTGPNLIYTPEKDFNGADSFTFSINDGKSDSDSATFSIMVTGVNDSPIAADDSVEIQEDTPFVTIPVLENDTDVDKDQLTVLGTTEGGYGSTVINNGNIRITYTPNTNFSGSDSFTYTISDGKGGTDTATVSIKINQINDAPTIKSRPVTTARVWGTYIYDVEATDPDPSDTLTYSLITKPEEMTINSATGLIEWKPTGTQAGTYDVQVKVEDANSNPASDTQEFTIEVASLDAPLAETITVKDGYNEKGQKILSAENKVSFFQTSDDKWYEISGGSYISCVFSDASIPAGATIASVVLYVEHFEQGLSAGKLKWNIGQGWPNNPDIWDSINTPIHQEQDRESTDSWDITSLVDTSEKLDSFQLQINNNSNITKQKTSIDNIYVVIRWY